MINAFMSPANDLFMDELKSNFIISIATSVHSPNGAAVDVFVVLDIVVSVPSWPCPEISSIFDVSPVFVGKSRTQSARVLTPVLISINGTKVSVYNARAVILIFIKLPCMKFEAS